MRMGRKRKERKGRYAYRDIIDICVCVYMPMGKWLHISNKQLGNDVLGKEVYEIY